MQHLDDVTGKRRKTTADMNSAERSEQMDAVVNQVVTLSVASNTTTLAVRALQAALNREIDDRSEADKRATRAVFEFQQRGFWARLRWIVTGR